MDPSQPAGSGRRTTAIIAAAGLACLAIAVPVSGAFGAGESGNAAGTPAQTPDGQGYGQGYGPPRAPNGQGQPPNGQRPPDGHCPKHRGTGQGDSGSSSGSAGPGVPDDAVAL